MYLFMCTLALLQNFCPKNSAHVVEMLLSLEKKHEACHEIGNMNVLLTNMCDRRDQQSLL